VTAYELFGGRATGSMIPEIALEFIGLPYRFTEAVPWADGPNLDRLRRLNPLCQVPTLVLPDGRVMTESAAMVLHLADVRPDSGLAPAPDDPTRPDFLRWLVFLVTNIYSTFLYDDFPERWVSDADARDELRRRVAGHRCRMWQVVEEAAGTPWFLGRRRSALDLCIAVMTCWMPCRDWFAAHCPRLAAVAGAVEREATLAPVFERNRRT
jgi:GST-like protein